MIAFKPKYTQQGILCFYRNNKVGKIRINPYELKTYNNVKNDNNFQLKYQHCSPM